MPRDLLAYLASSFPFPVFRVQPEIGTILYNIRVFVWSSERPCRLPAFGYPFWDEDEPGLRLWDVALKSPTQGEHTVVWTADIAGQQIEETWVFSVTDEFEFNE